jgi:hypothetical protein
LVPVTGVVMGVPGVTGVAGGAQFPAFTPQTGPELANPAALPTLSEVGQPPRAVDATSNANRLK